MSKERRKVCGIDIHKSFLVATILDHEGNSQTRKVHQNIESLLEFREWIMTEGCDSVAFESTGDYYLLNLVPKSGKSNYSKIVAKINKENGYVESMDIYDLKGKKFKEAFYKYEKVGKYWNASEVIMKDLEKNHSTKILVTDVKFDQGLPDDLFLVENLKPADIKKSE